VLGRYLLLFCAVLICIVPNVANAEIWQRAEVRQIIETESAVVKLFDALVGKASPECENDFSGNHVVGHDNLIWFDHPLSIKTRLVRTEARAGLDHLQAIRQIRDFETVTAIAHYVFCGTSVVPLVQRIHFRKEA